MTHRIATSLLAGVACLLLGACADDEANGPQRNFHLGRDPTIAGAEGGNPSGGGLTLFSTGKTNQGSQEGNGLAVNAYLWRGALETLKFMPLVSADPFGGVIITDWYQPPAAPGERFKATAYILGRQLRADAVRISVFRQVQQGGAWVDAPMAAGTATELENKVLAAARDLRAQSASSQ
jgi:hypothetical protein